HRPTAMAMAFDGKSVVIGTQDGAIVMRDLSNETTWTRPNWMQRVTCVAAAARTPVVAVGGVLASGANGRSGVLVLDLVKGATTSTIFPQQGNITSVALAPNGTRLFVGLSYGAVEVWNLERNEKVDVRGGGIENRGTIDNSAVKGLAVSPDNRYVAAGTTNGALTVWNLRLEP
ncbi:MAG TPA: hypothetical protein PLV92_13380, partial [Pirellulaceae bacterium]|nr:hypothetical protein [Pirellulaceae bacterium]